MIAVERLRKQYGATIAVESVSFVVPDAAVTGLLGPNGAGKTTTLRALSGLVRPDAGDVHIDGRAVRLDPAAARSRLGVLPETTGLYDFLTVREHLQYSGRLHGLSGPDLNARVERLLEQFALAACSDQRGAGLSLGQRRRVALARALVHNPPNVVLDEPTNGLDVAGAREVRREVRRLAERGCAVLLSSHVMPEVASVCDHVVILSKGSVIASGRPAELLERTGAGSLEDAFVSLMGTEEGLN
jgi:sodium transport system ATP-binding protein